MCDIIVCNNIWYYWELHHESPGLQFTFIVVLNVQMDWVRMGGIGYRWEITNPIPSHDTELQYREVRC